MQFSNMSNNKKRKISAPNEAQDETCVICFIPDRIQKARLTMFHSLAKKHAFNISSTFRDEVSHIVSAYDHRDQVEKALGLGLDSEEEKQHFSTVHIVNIDWFTDSVKCGRPVVVQNNHILTSSTSHHVTQVLSSSHGTRENKEIPKYACQRKSPLNHKNKKTVEALLSLADYADLRNDPSQNDYGRSLAFNKAAAVLKCLDYDISSVQQVKSIKDIGEHSKTVIQDILSNGFSSEVEELCSPWYNTVKKFTAIYGVGPATAKKWYDMGMRSIEDVVLNENISLRDERMLYGIAHFTELNTKVSKSEADKLLKFFEDELLLVDKELKAELMGGFKRGKTFGHDCDILISHPNEGEEARTLSKLHESLKGKDMILQGTKQSNTFNMQLLSDPSINSREEALDEFEKFLGIIKFKKSYLNLDDSLELTEEKKCYEAFHSARDNGVSLSHDRQKLKKMLSESLDGRREWLARRVDLVVTPRSQYAYAVLGWTGNKNFNRSIRLYARKVLNIKLSSHGMWSFTKQSRIPANTEEEIFAALHLIYIKPEDRNV